MLFGFFIFSIIKSNSIFDTAIIGIENIIPITPNIPPPIINAKRIVIGCIPVLSPIILGANTLFSIHCIPINKIPTHKALIGLSNKAKNTAGKKPKKGPK